MVGTLLEINGEIKMAEKTFKIGEYAKGGVITAKATKTMVTITGKEWDFSQGSSRNSSQSNAKPFTEITVNTSDYDAKRKLEDFLWNLTTPYYSDQVMDWVKSKTKFESGGNSFMRSW